tara:strand:+ start:2496 stop:3245 length:750 start_codon:yes stop_codon:yes gene_type:complete
MSLSKTNIRERQFHNQLHLSGEEDRVQQNKFYKALYALQIDFLDSLKIKTKSKDVLDYGCGTGSFAKKVSSFQPKKIVAVDISEEAIKKAKNRSGIENKNIEYRVENCENLNLNSETFDVVYGGGILHHLSLNKSLNELNRVLKKDGTMIFVEPLATNPLINLYRKFTPKARSPDERPFEFKDIKLIESIFKNVEIKYYGFLTLVFFPFYKSPENSKVFKFLSAIDRIILNTRYLKFLAWSVLIEAEKN